MPTFLNPVSGTIHAAGTGLAGEFVVTSPFGPRTSPFVGFHDGIDIANGRCGDPVYSSAAGTVLNSGTDTDGAVFGIIQHPDGWQTWYWHLTAEWLTNGASIAAGRQLGTVGSTGNSTACHLHFTIKQLVNGVYVAVDPWPLLAQNTQEEVMALGTKQAGNPLGTFTFGPVAHSLIATWDTAIQYPQPPGAGPFAVLGIFDLKDHNGKPIDINGNQPPLNNRDQVYLVDDARFGNAAYALRQDGMFIPSAPVPANCSVQVAQAVAPLNAQIAKLSADLTDANTKIANGQKALA